MNHGSKQILQTVLQKTTSYTTKTDNKKVKKSDKQESKQLPKMPIKRPKKPAEIAPSKGKKTKITYIKVFNLIFRFKFKIDD